MSLILQNVSRVLASAEAKEERNPASQARVVGQKQQRFTVEARIINMRYSTIWVIKRKNK